LFRDIPVQRQSAIVALRIGRSFVYDEHKGVFSIRHVASESLKGRGNSITVHLPVAWTPFYRRWLDQVRPVLAVDEAPNDFLFLSKTGTPLKTISRVLVKVLAKLVAATMTFVTLACRVPNVESRATSSGLRAQQVLHTQTHKHTNTQTHKTAQQQHNHTTTQPHNHTTTQHKS
jgi:hypothetical protein